MSAVEGYLLGSTVRDVTMVEFYPGLPHCNSGHVAGHQSGATKVHEQSMHHVFEKKRET